MKVLIVGGGFGGLAAARALARADVRVTLVDRRNHHLFQPLLYQVATAGLSPADIAEPIRSLLSDQANARVLLGEVVAVHADAHEVELADGERLTYDRLILAAGARHGYFGNPQWEQHAPGLKTLGDALDIRRRILTAFERAERTPDPKLMTFVVVGGGATGVELAGAIADIARRVMADDFRNIDTTQARVVLVEGGPRILGAFSAPLPEEARRQLEELGVEVRLEAQVTDVDEDGVSLGEERIEAATVVWAAGVDASPLVRPLGDTDRSGRVKVGPDLTVPGHPHVYVIGDAAHVAHEDGIVPGVAPAAQQMGRFVAERIRTGTAGVFRYEDKGSMATIGRNRAIAEVGSIKATGRFAWLLWLLIHLLTLVGLRNKAVVLTKWFWAWLVFDRSSRLVYEGHGSAPAAYTGRRDEPARQRKTT